MNNEHKEIIKKMKFEFKELTINGVKGIYIVKTKDPFDHTLNVGNELFENGFVVVGLVYET